MVHFIFMPCLTSLQKFYYVWPKLFFFVVWRLNWTASAGRRKRRNYVKKENKFGQTDYSFYLCRHEKPLNNKYKSFKNNRLW